MKKFGLFLLIWPGLVFAADVFPIAKVEEFIEKKKPCDLAVTHVIKSSDKRYMDCKTDCLPGDKIFCIGDGVINEGTIREKKGCLLAYYSMNRDRLETSNSGTYVIVEGKSCQSGGFEELLAKRYGATPNIKSLLSKPIGGMVYPVVLPSRNSKFADFMKTEIQKSK